MLHIIDLLPEESADQPLVSAQKILKELQRYDESLYQKPRWLVLNKLDLIPEEMQQQICDEIVEGLGVDSPVYRISALSREGVDELCRDIMTFIEENESL